MERKQLDFKAPLLSVRRFASPLGSRSENHGKKSDSDSLNRHFNLPACKSDIESDQAVKPAAVPFRWEQIPGRPKSYNGALYTPVEESSASLPPGKVFDIFHYHPEKEFGNQNTFRPQEASLCNENGVFDSEDDYYSDAVETLSLAEPSVNCSVSGLSGSDGPEVKPSGTFSTDPQTRDFILSRFLPAAKAMALPSPHYPSRKQPAIPEHPAQMKKVIGVQKQPSSNQYSSNIVSYCGQDIEEGESDSEEDNYSESGNISAKACGLLPQFCLKNALCILNPVPGLQPRPQASVSSTRKLQKPPKFPYVCSSKHDLMPSQVNISEGNHDRRVRSSELYEVVNTKMSEPRLSILTNGSQVHGGSSPHRRPGSGCVSPYRNGAPKSPFHEGVGFLGIPEVEKFKAGTQEKGRNSVGRTGGGSGSSSPVVEKTVYIDSVNEKGFPSGWSSLDAKRQVEESGGKTITEEASTIGKNRGEKPKPEILDYIDVAHNTCQAKIARNFKLNDPDHNESFFEANDVGKDELGSSKRPLAPPLPKFPSDSWLLRTLPSLTARQPSPLSRRPAPKTPNSTKWENIVKTSYLHHDHTRYSEELMPRVHKPAKT